MRVGSAVCARNPGNPLACGSGLYTHAIVTSMEPFILVSEEGDMLWSTTKTEADVYHVTMAEPEVVARCLERMYNDFPAMRPPPEPAWHDKVAAWNPCNETPEQDRSA